MISLPENGVIVETGSKSIIQFNCTTGYSSFSLSAYFMSHSSLKFNITLISLGDWGCGSVGPLGGDHIAVVNIIVANVVCTSTDMF